MDGTIVDSSHRYRTLPCGLRIDIDYWRANQHRAYDDALLPLARQYQEDLKNPEVFVIIATARILGGEDWRFIQEKLGIPNYIVSRQPGDDRRGAVLKIKGLQRFFNLRWMANATVTFYEDNADYLKGVCDHFNIRGVYIPSIQGH